MVNSCVAFAEKDTQYFSENTQTEWPHKWPHKIMYYDVISECSTLSKRKVRRALNLAMTTWDIEIEITFKPVWMRRRRQPKKTPNITIDFKSRDEDKMFKERPTVLAYAYFPGQGSVSGQIVFNDSYIWSTNGKSIIGKKAKELGLIDPRSSDTNQYKTYNIIHVLIHELGHSLGLRHDAHGDTQDVMDAYYSGKLNLSEWDILRIRLKYPARIFSRWSHYSRLKRAIRIIKSRL